MTLTTASDPAAWCHAELDTDELPEDLGTAAEGHGCTLDEVVFPDTGPDEADQTRLIEAIELLEADIRAGSERVRVHDLRQNVLDVWDMTEQVDPEAAEPLETLLGRLTTTTRVSQGSVTATLEEVRRRLHEGQRARR